MNINKTIIGALVGSVIFVSTAFAEITVVNPQKPGGGTTVWTEMKELLSETFQALGISQVSTSFITN